MDAAYTLKKTRGGGIISVVFYLLFGRLEDMSSENKFKEYMNAKVRLNPGHITLIVLLFLCIIAAGITLMADSIFKSG